ncbi:PTS sugar transporter subunit IIC [Facklamia sp. DSM 111018]|uniref:Permease IIC component n=1 Tax=Facklamia lactis TaxID=2749967 RepID=A0ABS0LNI2_9LACT|nr:PTS sugar transporter subunit IIC [Facklamia lactis]MBG9979592.1 PTS sugar transporter subunit IIC [Facklamia lactis]MBG9985728.1 PTS sugar transporter subunit IIC [Facklamia lactis]
MFEKLADFLDRKLSTPMAKMSEQRHLRAVRDGIVATLPIIIVASMFMVVAFLPDSLPNDWAFVQWIAKYQDKILLPYRVSMYIMTLYAVFGIGHSLAKSYQLDPLSGGILAELAYLLTIVPTMVPEVPESVTQLAKSNPELAEYIGQVPLGFQLPMANLGAKGMFIGILTAILAVEIYRMTERSGFKISMPEQVPASIARSFESLTPTAIILFIVAAITMWLEVDVHEMMTTLVTPLVSASDSLVSVLLLTFLNSFFWVFGIHGASIVGSLARPIWLMLFDGNTEALAAGATIPHVAAEPFYQWFIYIGGAGATIGLALALLITKSEYGKTLGKTTIIPAIFNINEPLIFGAPIVLNPVLMIPFIVAPIVNALIAWFATSMGLINRVVALPAWTLPGPIGAFLATGADWRAAVLSIILILLSTAIYYPFVKLYDKKLLLEEQGEEVVEEAKER